MSEPRVVVKKVKSFRGRDGVGINADVYINDIKCLLAIDEGNGGMMYFQNYSNTDQVKQNIILLEEYIKDLPPRPIGSDEDDYILDDNGNKKLFSVTMEVYINDFINDELDKKEKPKILKKRKKLQNTCILIGVPESIDYQYFKFKLPLSAIPTTILQRNVDKIRELHCKDGVTILNTNLESLNIV
jgi:hypothetical protein